MFNNIGLAALVAVGLVMLTGVGGMTSFGQAAFVGIGAYASAWLCTSADLRAAIGPSVPAALLPWAGLLLGLLVTFAVAWLLGAVTVRLSGHYLPLGTIAWGLGLYYLFGNLNVLGGHTGMTGVPPITHRAAVVGSAARHRRSDLGRAAAGAVGLCRTCSTRAPAAPFAR